MNRSFGNRVQRAVRAEPFSPSPNSTTIPNSRNFNSQLPTSPKTASPLSASSSSSSSSAIANGGSNSSGTPALISSLISLPPSATSATLSSFICGDDGSEWARAFVFGTVPSTDEVHHALAALQHVLESSYNRLQEENTDEVGNAIIGSERRTSLMGWIEPSSFPYNSNMVKHRGSDKVYDSLRLLRNDRYIQRMVTSLSTDKAVWDAVMNNEVVKELKESTNPAGEEGSDEGPDGSNSDMLSWIIAYCKAKISQLIDKILNQFIDKIVNEFVQQKKGESAVPSDEKRRTGVLLSIAVIFIVIITRARGARS